LEIDLNISTALFVTGVRINPKKSFFFKQ